MIVEANASANPAVDALILGVIKQTRPVAPTIPAESKLKRTESQRFTNAEYKQWYQCKDWGCFTSPHPVVRIRVLFRVSNKYRASGKSTIIAPCQHNEAYLSRIWRMLRTRVRL